MEYKYLITQEIQSKLDKENIGNDIREKLNSYLISNSQLKASSLMANLLVSKIYNHSGPRFVWFQEIRQDYCIYILRRIYRHDEYMKKLTDATKQNWAKRHELTTSERMEVESEFKAFFKDEQREPLPEEYRKYEDKRAFDKYKDIVFYEMPLWNDGMKKVPKEYWIKIQEALSEDIMTNYKQFDAFMYHTTNDYTITYRFGNPNQLNKCDIYLLQIVKGREPNLEELLDRKYDCDEVADLQNFSSKCYPDYYTYEYEAWKEVEEDDMANLALSEEEVRILQNAQFPFFVSGLAGSGKSTILYYLYANIYKYLAKEKPGHKILFMSYNDMLVDKARLSVRSILKYHKSNQDYDFKTYFNNEENTHHFNKCFVSFRDFLKLAFLNEGNIGKFNEDKHITYEKFRELYFTEYKHGKKLSPSIVWSVIHSFIKGRSLNYFTPEDYESDAITRNDRTVDPKIYAEAYKIWNDWYRHYYEDGERWDDLDLVKYVLTHGDFQNVFHEYSVIFCDEAQDFTKLEIDLILSLSKHSKFNLSLNPDDKRIPIAFAGDPNQTINPTGFRWAGTKAIFSKAFKDALTGYPELDDLELSKNYRSQLGIVKFANTIQSIRYKYFDETSKDRKLQSVREDLKGESKDALEYVGFYFYDKDKDTIIENLSNANIITAGDGEEGDISLFPELTGKNVKLNTAIGTKGLEYNAVMIFNFTTDPAFKSFQKIVNEEDFYDDSERFEIAHFFTKLYIAISRAKNQLFIVDTTESYELFWKYFTDHDLWEKLMVRFVKDDEKRKLIGHLTFGDIETLPQRLSDTYDAEGNGRQAFEKAKADRSVSMMKRAQSYFLEAGLTALADECDAYIYLYNFEYEKAGDKFVSLNQEDNNGIASAAYWKGKCWKKIINILNRKVDLCPYDHIRLLASNFMEGKHSPIEFMQSVITNLEYFQDAIVSHLDDQTVWVDIFIKLETSLATIDDVNISISLMKNLEIISRYTKWYKKGFAALRASLFFKRDEFHNAGLSRQNEAYRTDGYENAIRLWEEINQTENNKDYFKAKKLISKTDSDEIIWMDVLKEHDEILNRFGTESIANTLTDEAASIVFTCLLNKNYDQAVAYPFPKDKNTKWNRLYANNPIRFFTEVVLTDFTPEKFYFLTDKVQREENNIFDDKLPIGIFDIIFSLRNVDESGKPYWTYFTSMLKDEHGSRILKQENNRINILESLSKLIKDGNYDKVLASCFLEMLFDKDFNTARADKFKQAIINLFTQDLFFKEDFRRITQRNKYFTQINDLDNEEHDTIKNNICRYAEHYLANVRKVNSSSMTGIKAMMRAYEICVAYQGIYPDYQNICTMYRKHLRTRKEEEINTWMQQRIIFNQYLDNGVLQRSSFNDFKQALEEKKINLIKVCDDFTKEDAARFIATSGIQEKDYSFDRVFVSTKLIYKHHLRRENFKPYCKVNDLSDKLKLDIDKAINEVLSNKQRIDEYAIKILTYTWEALFDYTYTAEHYDELVQNTRLIRLSILTEYLKKRALLHYSHMKAGIFKEQQKKYGISMSKDYLPAAYPHIEEKNSSGNDSSTKNTDEKSQNSTKQNRTATKNVKSEDSEKRTSKRTAKSSFTPNIDPAKMQLFDVARTLKNMGQSVDFIYQAVSKKLTLEEIASLWESED